MEVEARGAEVTGGRTDERRERVAPERNGYDRGERHERRERAERNGGDRMVNDRTGAVQVAVRRGLIHLQ